jgi:hypothetical protein
MQLRGGSLYGQHQKVARTDSFAWLVAIELWLPEVEKMPTYLNPAIALIAGILILVQPKLLNYIIAIYLIVIGVLGLLRI